MRKQYIIRSIAFRFKRWSRKGYAAFISVQRAVTIGQLSANVSERFQVKNGSIHAAVLSFGSIDEDGTEEEEEDEPGNEGLWDIRLLGFLQTVSPVQVVNRPAASYALIVKNNISESAEGFSQKLKAFRAFRLYK